MEQLSFFRRLIIVASFLALSPASAQEGQTLSVRLDGQSQSGSPSNRLTVTVKNVSDHTVYLPRHRTPLFTPEGHLMGNLFDVEDAGGHQAKFIGRYVRISPVNPSHYFARLDPGQSLSHDIDLAADYDLSIGGHYKVRYAQDFVASVKTDEAGEIASTADAHEVSNLVEIIADRGLALLMKSEASAAGAGLTCEAEQMTIVRGARSTSPGLVLKALNAIEALFVVKEGKDSNGNTTYTGQIKQDNAYTYWFGAPNNNGKVYLSRPSYTDYWKTDDDFVMMRNINSIYLRIGAEGYLCGCSSEYPPETAAWTNTSTSTINLCDRFFALPTSSGPYDSKLLTLIHEYSHFVDSWESSTGDYAYGMSGAHTLSTSNRENAVRNADNIMYYVGTFNDLTQP